MGGNRARGSWEQTQGQTQSQTQHKQRPQVPLTQLLSQSPACATSSSGTLCQSILCLCFISPAPFDQATAEQIRLAQMISDHNDADFEEKVKQVSKDVFESHNAVGNGFKRRNIKKCVFYGTPHLCGLISLKGGTSLPGPQSVSFC